MPVKIYSYSQSECIFIFKIIVSNLTKYANQKKENKTNCKFMYILARAGLIMDNMCHKFARVFWSIIQHVSVNDKVKTFVTILYIHYYDIPQNHQIWSSNKSRQSVYNTTNKRA